jgi:selenocysteine lyase/cysteine desulfurase
MSQTLSIDQFIRNPDEFPILEKWAFFNHAGVAPLSRRAAMAIVKYAGQAAEDAYIDSGWFKQIETLRKTLAGLINADRSEIAFVKNTSEGLALVANGIDWQPGDRIVTTAVEYPANAYPWIDLQQRKGIELIRVEEKQCEDGARRVPLQDILAAADHPRTRLVTLSHVEFGTGQRHDLVAVGAFCRPRKIGFCVDGIQSVGVLPVDVRAMNIDYLSADGHKWMLGPEGAGFFYCRQELIEHTHPALVGWLNVKGAHNFDKIDYQLRADAGRFECGTLNVPGLLGLKGSIDLIAQVGIDAISRQVFWLTESLVNGLRNRRFTVSSPRNPSEWSGIVSFTREGLNTAAVAKKLKADHHIELAVRAGRLRCSPHFYNSKEQIAQLLEALGTCMREG